MKNSEWTKKIVILGLLTAIMIVLSSTPIGTIPIGPLSVSLNMIPVAIAAVTLGPVGGAIAGAIFGLLSFLQCFGIGIPSGMGATLVSISPFLAFVQRFVPRVLDGLLVGIIHKAASKKLGVSVSSFITGFCAAFFNTLFFMSALIMLFGNTEYVQGLMDGKGTHNVFLFVCLFVGINAVCEMVASTILTGAVGTALYKAKLIPNANTKTAKAE